MGVENDRAQLRDRSTRSATSGDHALTAAWLALAASFAWQAWNIYGRDVAFLVQRAAADDAVVSFAATAGRVAGGHATSAADAVTPLWQMLLSGLATISVPAEPFVRTALFCGALMRLATGLLVERMGRSLGGAAVGASAAIAWAAYHLHPASMVSLESSLSGLAFSGAAWCCLAAGRHAGAGRLIGIATLLGLTSLAEPSAAVVCGMMAIGIVAMQGRGYRIRSLAILGSSLLLILVGGIVAVASVGEPRPAATRSTLLPAIVGRLHHGDNTRGEFASVAVEAFGRTLFGAPSFRFPWSTGEVLVMVAIALVIVWTWMRRRAGMPGIAWWIVAGLFAHSLLLAAVLQESADSPRYQAPARVVTVIGFGGLALVAIGRRRRVWPGALLVALPVASCLVYAAGAAFEIPPPQDAAAPPQPGPLAGPGSPARNATSMPDVPHIFVDAEIGEASCRTYDRAKRACEGGSEQAFESLAAAVKQATEPGIQVWIRGGTYHEALVPAASGTEQKPILFRGYSNEAVTLTGSLDPAIDLTDRANVAIEGLTVRDVTSFVRAVRTTGSVIRFSHFENASGSDGRGGITYQAAERNRLLDSVVKGGNENVLLLDSNRTVIASNQVSHGRTALLTVRCGAENVIRSNIFTNELHAPLARVGDCAGIPQGPRFRNIAKRTIIERNLFLFTGGAGGPSSAPGLDYAGQDGIVRLNAFAATAGPGLRMSARKGDAAFITGNRIYQNVFFRSFYGGILLDAEDGASLSDNIFKNNILAENTVGGEARTGGSAASPPARAGVQILVGLLQGYVIEQNIVFAGIGQGRFAILANTSHRGDPLPGDLETWQRKAPAAFKDNVSTRPLFKDERRLLLELGGQSVLIDKGSFLTITTQAGSGTRLPVRDARYFSWGFGVPGETGDAIQLAGDRTVARVVGVEEGSSILQLDRPLTWQSGLGVGLRYQGAAPDPGYGEHVETPHSEPVVIHGTERFAWDHQPDRGTTYQDYSFYMYVDDERRTLSDVECGPDPNTTRVTCSAPLPPMSDGTHELRLTAVRRNPGAATRESLASAPLGVLKKAADDR